MRKNRYWLLIFLLFSLTLAGIAGDFVFAAPAANVGLTRFEVIPLDNAVRLEWDTDTELETAGFMIMRGQNNAFDYLADPTGSGRLFIVSEGGPASGFNYVHVDETVVNGDTFTYRLIEVEVDGSEILHAESTITVGIVPTNTPIVVGISGGSGNNDNASSATPTATQQAVGSPNPTSETNSTSIPSATTLPTSAPPKSATTVPIAQENAPDLATALPPSIVGPRIESEELLIDSLDQSDGQDESSIAVAFAQEDPENYPADDASEDGGDGIDPMNELQGSTEIQDNSERPDVIGAPEYPADSSAAESDLQPQDIETTSVPSGSAGIAYLWIAFIAALVIFTAAVLGAILLYTRQRSKE